MVLKLSGHARVLILENPRKMYDIVSIQSRYRIKLEMSTSTCHRLHLDDYCLDR